MRLSIIVALATHPAGELVTRHILTAFIACSKLEVRKQEMSMRSSILIPALAVLVIGSDAALASDWGALVIAQSQSSTGSSIDDAARAWQALDASGIPVVGTILNGTVTAMYDATMGMTGTSSALIYYSGSSSTGGLAMSDGSVGLETLMETASRAGVTQLVMMIENCPAGGSESPFHAVLPQPPEGLEVIMFTSADETTRCAVEDRLTSRLERIAQFGPAQDDLRAVLAGLPFQGAITGGVNIASQATGNQGFEDIEFLPDDVILLDVVDGQQAAASVQVMLPVVTQESETAWPDQTEPMITLAVLPAEQIVALPLVAGQPEPSIIVGMIDGITDAALSLDGAQQDESRALAYDDVDARRALKSNNPDLFDLLLAAGSLDPPDSQLALALQTELQRMNCYTLRVDGDWGNGSRRAFQAYLDRLENVQVASLDANVDLFRLILRNDEVVCPVAAPAAAAATTRSAAPARTTPTQPTPPAAAQPTPTAPAREPTGGGFPGNFGGVFR